MHRSLRLIRIHSKHTNSIRYWRFKLLLVVNYVLQKYCIWFWRHKMSNIRGAINSLTNLQSHSFMFTRTNECLHRALLQTYSIDNKEWHTYILHSHGTRILMASSGYNSNQKCVFVLTAKPSSQIHGGHICVRYLTVTVVSTFHPNMIRQTCNL